MAGPERIRLDKWLWQARLCKTRSLAAATVAQGWLRLNGVRMVKPGHPVGPGDVLTFPQGGRIRVLRIRACGSRRGPAAEARLLYDDLAPPGPDAPPDPGAPAGPPAEG